MRQTYEVVSRDPDTGAAFAGGMVAGPQHGDPIGVVVHRQDNPGVSAIEAIRYAIRTGAFSVHWYVDGMAAYECVPEDRHAYHVLEWRVADAVGRRVYPSRFAAAWPTTLSAPVNGQYAGWSKPRGDIGLLGIEMVDRRRPDGSIYLDQDTRITTLLLLRGILRRAARRAGRYINDLVFPVVSHAMLDPYTRADDPGQALYMLDLRADLLDLIVGRDPWRTVGFEYDGRQAAPDRHPPGVTVDITEVLSHVAAIEADTLALRSAIERG